MKALKLYRTGGVLCKWGVKIPSPRGLFCPYHSAQFIHTGFSDEMTFFNEEGEEFYIREYTCEDCLALQNCLEEGECFDEEIQEPNDWWGPTIIHDDEDTLYLFRKDYETGLYYLEPTQEEMLQKDREVLEAAGQLRLPFLDISSVEAS